MFGRLGSLTNLGGLGAFGASSASIDEAVTISARASVSAGANATGIVGISNIAAVEIETDPAAEFNAIATVTASGLAAYKGAPAISNIAGVTAAGIAGRVAAPALSNIAGVSIERTVGYTISDADAQAVVDNMDTEPNDTRKELIDNFVAGLKTDSLWTLLDRLWIMAAHEQGATARLDWKSPATVGRRLTEVNSPTFTADQGYTGDGSTSYLNTNYTPSTDGVNFVLNSASAGVWVRAVGTSSRAGYMGHAVSSDPLMGIRRETDGTGWTAFGPNDNSGSFTPGTTLSQNATGLLVANRSASNATQAYRNGASEGTSTQVSSSVLDKQVILLSVLSSESDGQISAAFAGASLNATQQANLHTRLNTYMTGL